MLSQPVVKIQHLVSNEQCYATIRKLRWPDGPTCPRCNSVHVIKKGHDETQVCRQKYGCKDCGGRFDDLTDTVFSGHHQPPQSLGFMSIFHGVESVDRQISQELDLNKDDVQEMTTQLREGVEKKNSRPIVG